MSIREDNFDLTNAGKVLNEDHFGLDNVKERILEHLAVLKLKGDMKSPIICLYGPPGVGKTSLGKSVASALGRKYIRMSLGGLHDESEIRGHRKTYIGAMPGRIIQNLIKAGSSNPVFILDEIDKVSKDFHGDPASALLEVLDPEQILSFTTTTWMSTLTSPGYFYCDCQHRLHYSPCPQGPDGTDRCERLPDGGEAGNSQTPFGETSVGKSWHGEEKYYFSREILVRIIENYTRESGVRELDKMLAKVVRRVARKIVSDTGYNKKITEEDLRGYLGVPKYTKDSYEGERVRRRCDRSGLDLCRR